MKIKTVDPIFVCEYCGGIYTDAYQCSRHEELCRGQDVILYSKCCNELMSRIEEIGREKYPKGPIHIGTEPISRMKTCKELLDNFEKDLK